MQSLWIAIKKSWGSTGIGVAGLIARTAFPRNSDDQSHQPKDQANQQMGRNGKAYDDFHDTLSSSSKPSKSPG
jgi:hypothetical protein